MQRADKTLNRMRANPRNWADRKLGGGGGRMRSECSEAREP
jgi:hypothetical protein